jgi:cytoskeleton protein RodZ
LEDGHISLLPGNAYAVGYARTYARALGLDAEEMVRRFKAEAAEVGRRTELAFPVPMPDRGSPTGALILLGLVLSIGAYIGWYRLSGDGHLPAETVTAIPERLAPLAEQALPAPTKLASSAAPGSSPTSTSPSAPAGSPAPAGISVPATSAAANPVASAQVAASDARFGASQQVVTAAPGPTMSLISPISAAAAPIRDVMPNLPLVPAAPEPLPVVPAVSAVEPAAPVPDQSRIVLHATADAWIQVKDRGGALLLNRILKAGEVWSVPRQDNLLLTTGNAGGTELLVDGATAPSLGASGMVRHDLPLDPDLIKGGKLASVPARQVASTRARQ